LVLIVYKPADDENIRFRGDAPETGLDPGNLLVVVFWDDCQKKMVAFTKHLHHLAHNPPGCIAIDRNAAQGFENYGPGKDKPFLLDHDMAGFPDDLEVEERADGVPVGGMGGRR
jgi:hypothetical protein